MEYKKTTAKERKAERRAQLAGQYLVQNNRGLRFASEFGVLDSRGQKYIVLRHGQIVKV